LGKSFLLILRPVSILRQGILVIIPLGRSQRGILQRPSFFGGGDRIVLRESLSLLPPEREPERKKKKGSIEEVFRAEKLENF